MKLNKTAAEWLDAAWHTDDALALEAISDIAALHAEIDRLRLGVEMLAELRRIAIDRRDACRYGRA